MKKVYLILFAILVSTGTFAQKDTSGSSSTNGQLGNMGIITGCNDAKQSNANARYLQIMQSSAQQQEYKSGYDTGWHACYKTSGKYTYYKGVLVFEGPKTKPGGKVPGYSTRPTTEELTTNPLPPLWSN